jgi:hypothetical protein
MSDLAIRIHFSRESGEVEDAEHDCDLSDFGGFLPSIGDRILDPGASGDRRDPANRRMWTVVGRIFNPRDLGNKYVALIVEERQPAINEKAFLPRG